MDYLERAWNQARSPQTPDGEKRLCVVAAPMGDRTKLRLGVTFSAFGL
jgi:hypothetical protein